ncbi:Uncharacterised protein [Serratia rubidaea]|uniref:Glyoxalase-like domain n=1 Tax=Serratia rubidaea TaxID=61652 RepID=A0A3S4FR03_SERRU|nr:Uncharacterised protein [Serratia rubidaea]
MSVIGIEQLEFGVEDLPKCEKFMRDFGLQAAADRPSAFTTLSGAGVQLRPLDDDELPPAFEGGSTLRRMTWAWPDRRSWRNWQRGWRRRRGFSVWARRWSAAIPTA